MKKTRCLLDYKLKFFVARIASNIFWLLFKKNIVIYMNKNL